MWQRHFEPMHAAWVLKHLKAMYAIRSEMTKWDNEHVSEIVAVQTQLREDATDSQTAQEITVQWHELVVLYV